MSLDLTPNPIVGYRLRADWYSINPVVLKQRGANSRNAGQVYEETLAYCRNVEFAADWLFHHIIRAEGAKAQASQEALDGSLASVEALMSVVKHAQEQVQLACAELQQRLDGLGLSSPKSLVKALNEQPEADGATAAAGTPAGQDEAHDGAKSGA
ncbi:hypothetical protein D3C71_21160 [compost metagenome]